MTDQKRPAKPKADIDQVLKEFDGKRAALNAFGETTKDLIEEILRYGNIQFQSVQARVKSRDKLKEKYLDPRKDYGQLDDITDQIALRIITYYEDEIDRVAEIVKKEFSIDPKNSLDKRETEPNRFGYYALNYVCQYLPARVAHVEYKKFADVWFEIQITSVLRHAWAEIEHPWYDLKDAFPDNIKRRFARMSALLEIAEAEFLSLRKLQSDYQQSVAVQVEANVSDLAVDAVSMKSFIEQERLVAEIDREVATIRHLQLLPKLSDRFAERRSRSATLAGMTKLQDVRESLKKYRTAIIEYVRRREQEVQPRDKGARLLNPGICIQHLSNMLVSARGAEETAKYLEALNIQQALDIAREVAIAREAIAGLG